MKITPPKIQASQKRHQRTNPVESTEAKWYKTPLWISIFGALAGLLIGGLGTYILTTMENNYLVKNYIDDIKYIPYIRASINYGYPEAKQRYEDISKEVKIQQHEIDVINNKIYQK